MALHTVEAGRHRERLTWRALLDRLPWFSLTGRPVWQRTVVFTDSCRYALPGVEQHDVNKLGGLAFGGGPHGTSARVGWRYDTRDGSWLLYAYCYVDGKRKWSRQEWPLLGRVSLIDTVRVGVRVTDFGFETYAISPRFSYSHPIYCDLSWWQRHVGLRLGLFFGGNLPAPQRIEIEVE